MKYWPKNRNKKKYCKKLSVEFKKPITHSENNDNEKKSKNSNETLNLFKGIVKVTKKTLKEKNTPETQSNTINNNNNIFDFTNYVYNNEEHLNNDKLNIIKSSKDNNSPTYYNAISPSSILKSKNKIFNKSKSSLEISNFSNHISNEQIMKKTFFNKNSKKLSLNYHYNNTVRRKQKRGSVIGNMTHKNRNNHNFHFFFKLKEKDKIPSKTPYLDKIWNFSNSKFDSKPKTNIHTKNISDISLIKQNSYEINTNNKINKTNIKSEKEKKDEIFDKLENDKNKKTIEKKQEEKIEKNETKKSDKIILAPEKVKKSKIIFNLLNKPFFCCLK